MGSRDRLDDSCVRQQMSGLKAHDDCDDCEAILSLRCSDLVGDNLQTAEVEPEYQLAYGRKPKVADCFPG